MRMLSPHPIPDADLIRYLEGESSRADEIATHLGECLECQSSWRELQRTLGAVVAADQEFISQDLGPLVVQAVAQPAARPRFAWFGLYGALAAASVGGIVAVANSNVADRAPEQEFRAKGAGPASADAWVGLHLFAIDGGGTPSPVSDSLTRGAGVLFAYDNLGPQPFEYLMIFAVDANGEVYWFHPGHTDAGGNPTSIVAERGRGSVELHELVRHDFPPGPLLVSALFTRHPMEVSSVERQIARDGFAPRGAQRLDLADSAQQVLRLEVRE
jgi:hypothetical protein